MEIRLKQGDRLPIPEGCKAVIEGDVVLIEKKENEFKDGDVVKVIALNGRSCPFIFKGKDKKGYNMLYVGLDCYGDIVVATPNSRFGNYKPLMVTAEEEQLLFDKMAEKGLKWNGEEKKVEKIRWRAGLEMTYYSLNSRLEAIPFNEDFCGFDDEVWYSYNYFRTQEQAEKAAEVVKKALRKFHEENG